MADISDVLGIRTGSRAFSQGYLSARVVSTLGKRFPLPFLMLGQDGTKTGMMGIGNPRVGTLITKNPDTRAREQEIYGAEAYYPLIHSQQTDLGDSAIGQPMRGNMPVVAGGSGIGGQITCVMSGTTGAMTIGTLTIVSGGSLYPSDTTLSFSGGGGVAPAASTLTIGAGGVITAATCAAGSVYLSAPNVQIVTPGTSSDQHFTRPFCKWFEIITPGEIAKKPMDRLKNLKYTASKGDVEARLANLLKVGNDEMLMRQVSILSGELWGTSISGGQPTSQTAEVWDHLGSAPSAMHTTNTYGGVDRTVAANAWWLGKRTTSHVQANLVGLYNEATYTNKIYEIGDTRGVLLCGPSTFPQFVDQVRGSGVAQFFEGGMPDMGQFGFTTPALKYNGMWAIVDPGCPDKLNTDPLTGSAYTKNAAMYISLDTFTMGFMPGKKFTPDTWFDQSKIRGGKDAVTNNMRTELFMICEAPAFNYYWEDVG